MLFLFIAAPLESVMLSHNNRKETYTVKGFMEDASTVCYVAFSEGAHINSRVTRACFDETWMRMPDNGRVSRRILSLYQDIACDAVKILSGTDMNAANLMMTLEGDGRVDPETLWQRLRETSCVRLRLM